MSTFRRRGSLRAPVRCPLADSDFDGAPHAPRILVGRMGAARAVGEHLDHSQMGIPPPEPRSGEPEGASRLHISIVLRGDASRLLALVLG